MPGMMPDPIKKNMSMFNPADMGAMKQMGGFNKNMTVRQVFEKFGIDVDGPADQLQQFAKQQVQNANPMNKMRNIAGGTPPGGPGGTPLPPSPGGPPGGPGGPPPGGGIEELMRR